MSESNLKSKTTKGLVWSAAERFSVQGVQFILGLVLARLLLPADYGLIGMLAIFLAISQTVVDSGFSSALIQKKDRSEVDYSTAFYFNIVVGLVFYGILYGCAPLIASFYKSPELIAITRVIGLTVFLASLTVVQRARLTIALDFKTQAKASLISVVISGITGIALAYSGYGVWSLVVQSVLRHSLETILLWLFSNWIPRHGFSNTSFKKLFSFGSKLLGAGLLNTIFENLYLLVIGKLFNARELGFFARATQLEQMPSKSITGVIQRVSYPVLSELQHDDEKLGMAFRRFMRLAIFIIFPLMVGLGILAEPLIRLVLTEKWLPMVDLVQLLCVIGMLYPIHALNLNVLNVKGRSDLFLKLEILKKIFIIVAILVSFPYGVKAMVIGQIVTSIMSFFLNTYYTGRIANFGTVKQLKELYPFVLLTAGMGFCVWFVSSLIETDILNLLLSALTGFIVYVTFSWLMKMKEISELSALILKRKSETRQ